MWQANVNDALSVKFDPTNPFVGIADGVLVMKSQASNISVPYQLIGDEQAVKAVDKQSVANAVNGLLAEQRWNVSVVEVR